MKTQRSLQTRNCLKFPVVKVLINENAYKSFDNGKEEFQLFLNRQQVENNPTKEETQMFSLINHIFLKDIFRF